MNTTGCFPLAFARSTCSISYSAIEVALASTLRGLFAVIGQTRTRTPLINL
jgi:hypothetical protein